MITFEKISFEKCEKIKELLSQLTDVGNINRNGLKKFISNLGDNHYIYFIKFENNIAGMGTLLIENKIIHNFGKVGHIEDIVIDYKFRGLGLGNKLINYLINLANKNNCYKVILNCNSKVESFYKKCGFTLEGSQMVIRFK